MADRKQQVVNYADWSYGEFGSLGSWNAPKGSFTSSNVMRYVDGSLGPRNGLKQYTLTGTTASPINAAGMWLGNKLWFQLFNDDVYSIDPLNMASQAVSSVASAGQLANQSVTVGNDVYFIALTGGIFRVQTPSTVSAVASTPSGTSIAAYGDRVVAAGSTSQPQRLYYSAAGDPTTWSASDFIDVGVGTAITALIPLRGALAIVTSSAYSSQVTNRFSWWLLTGVPGVNDTLREVVRAQGPNVYGAADVLQDGRVAFIASVAEVVGFFDGSKTDLLRHLPSGTKGVTDEWTVVAMRDESDVYLHSDVGASSNVAFGYFRRDGTWLKQAFAEANVGYNVVPIFDGTVDPVVMIDKSATPKFYAWLPYNDRPPFTTDTFASILTSSGVYFELPEWWTKDDDEVSVRKVVVSFRDWDTDDSDPNTFDVAVTPLRKYEGGEGSTQTQSFSRATSASAAAGVNLRRDFNFSDDYGNGFKLKIANMRGVAIQKIQVVLNVRPPQGL